MSLQATLWRLVGWSRGSHTRAWMSLNTVKKLMIEAGEACAVHHDETVRDDLRSRLANRVQLTTDGYGAYLEAVESAIGNYVDYAQLIKLYGEAPDAEKRYSPAQCIGAHKRRVTGRRCTGKSVRHTSNGTI